jgi:hypothetical protein
MTAWTPAESETDPLEKAIHAVVRHVLMPGVVPAVGELTPEGWYKVTLEDGRRAVIEPQTHLRPDRRWGPRAVVSHDLVCRATLEHDGFEFEGRAVIDVATKAFLEIEGSLTATGRVD